MTPAAFLKVCKRLSLIHLKGLVPSRRRVKVLTASEQSRLLKMASRAKCSLDSPFFLTKQTFAGPQATAGLAL